MFQDSLYRVSFKCFIQDEQGRVLVVKEKARESWDLPGGGIDHGESIKSSIQRELKEEVDYEGDFTYSIFTIDDPDRLLTRDVWSIRVVVRVIPETLDFGVGNEADEILFIEPSSFRDSSHECEQRIYEYVTLKN